MQSPNQPVSPLRLRMLEDMRMRQLAHKTQAAYIHAVRHRKRHSTKIYKRF